MFDLTGAHCTLSPEEQHARRLQMRTSIVQHVLSVTSMTDGLQIEFSSNADVREMVKAFIVFEQTCCSFLEFTISEPGEDLALKIQGPPEAARIIELFRQTALGEYSE